uniref:Uncharacterized protein n=1 Tax=Anopheles atroparvus TaxID=41427 RepID=A0A182JHR8_ANOAO
MMPPPSPPPTPNLPRCVRGFALGVVFAGAGNVFARFVLVLHGDEIRHADSGPTERAVVNRRERKSSLSTNCYRDREVTRYSYSGNDVSNCSSWRVRSFRASSSSPLSGPVSASVSIRLPSTCASSVIVSAPLDCIRSNSCSAGAFWHSRKNFASSFWAVDSANAKCSSFSIRSSSDGSRRIDHRDDRRSSPPTPPSELGGEVPVVLMVVVLGIATVPAPVVAEASVPNDSPALPPFGDCDRRKCMGPAPPFDSYDPLLLLMLLLLLLMRLFALLEQFSSTVVGECSETRSSPQSRKAPSSRGFGSSQLYGGVSGIIAYVLGADILQEVIALQHDRVVASGLRWRERNLRPVGHCHV